MTELKRCPFCGGAGRILTHLTEDKFTIECLGCGMRLRWFRSGEEAMESWNSRVTDWHTGTPTEGGLFLVHLKSGEYDIFSFNYGYNSWDIGFRDVVAWQKIEPYKEVTE